MALDATEVDKLSNRIQELEKRIEELSSKIESEDTKPKDADEDAEKKDEKDQKSPFGSLPELRLALYDSRKLTATAVNKSDDQKACAIVAFYDVPSSVAHNLKAWEEGSLVPSYTPCRISINSKKILELLKSITDTTMNEAPCIIVPPFKIFATYWTEIQEKLKSLQDDFLEKYNQRWDAKDATQATGEKESKSKAGEDVEKEEAGKDEAKKAGKDKQDGAAQDILHLQCLVDFMEKYLHEIPKLREQVKTNQIESVSFDELWHLFNPGDIVIGRSLTGKCEQQAYQVFTVMKGRCNMKERKAKGRGQQDRNDLQLQCFWLDYDGTRFDTREELLAIKPFVGKKKITELDYYPKSFATKQEIKAMQERARKFLENLYGHGRCEGITTRFETEHIDNEEVFVDFKSGYEELKAEWKPEIRRFGVVTAPDCSSDETYEPSCGMLDCATCSNTFYLDEQIDIKRAEVVRGRLPKPVPGDKISEVENTPDSLLLLPRHLLVYTLRDKKWHFVDVGDFKKIVVTAENIREGWKNLVIDAKIKRLLKAMVNDHSTTLSMDKASLARAGTAIDIVLGKGRGRIVFLYGPPGVGKTSTAETIAAYTDPPRPLYPITCGDLSSDPKLIQEALEGHFKLAHRWNCVLLLDEADVYLAERHHHTDLDRNGIVSVFLRTLEYYSGILFLTSNRIGAIDPAFKSRIHMAIKYKKIDASGTREIWNNILNGIDRDNDDPKVRVKIQYERDDLLAWAAEHFDEMEANELPTWNGRQIRNAFQSAIALASHDRLEKIRKKGLTEGQAMKRPSLQKIPLLEKHFDEVSMIVKEFEDYLIGCGKGEDKAVKEGLLAREPSTAQLAPAYGSGAAETARPKPKRPASARPSAPPRRPSQAQPPPSPARRGLNMTRRPAAAANRRAAVVVEDDDDEEISDEDDIDEEEGDDINADINGVDANGFEAEDLEEVGVEDGEDAQGGYEDYPVDDAGEGLEEGDDRES